MELNSQTNHHSDSQMDSQKPPVHQVKRSTINALSIGFTLLIIICFAINFIVISVHFDCPNNSIQGGYSLCYGYSQIGESQWSMQFADKNELLIWVEADLHRFLKIKAD